MQSLVFGFQKLCKTNYLKINKVRCTFYDEMDLFFKQEYFFDANSFTVYRKIQNSKVPPYKCTYL